MRRISLRAAAAVTVFTASAALTCAGPLAHAAVTPGDWPTYHLNNQRDGDQTKLDPLSTLSIDWTASVDGEVYGEPLVVGGRVFAATENDTVYALNRWTGSVVWSAHVGTAEPLSDLPCGNITPTVGITSTMVYDPDTNRLFAVAETTGGTHTLVGLNADTGTAEVSVNVNPPKGDPLAQLQRPALTLLNGRIYIAYGGLFGDCGNYVGQVVSVTTGGTGMTSYAVPTSREGAIWGPAGAALDGGQLLYSVGNGAANTAGATYDGSDSVIELSPDLQQTDLFAPTDWATQNAGDADLASMSPALVGQYVYADGKAGIGYVLQRGHLGGIGGQIAELNNNCQAYGGSAVVGNTIYLPCSTGTQAVTVGADGTPQLLWKTTAPTEGSPVVGGGAVWAVDYFGGVLYALDPATGAVKAQIRVGQAPNFVSPTLVGDQAFVGTMNSVVAVGGA
jgi:outer membrane protein assembly factor BamB